MATEKRLIDANALYINLGKLAREPDYQHEDEIWSVGVAMAMGEVWSAPTVDAVEVVHGEWIEEAIYDKIICDVCGHEWNILDNDTETFNYCPNCGADMRERKDNE